MAIPHDIDASGECRRNGVVCQLHATQDGPTAGKIQRAEEEGEGAAPHSGMTVNSIGGGGEVITEEQEGRGEGNQSIKVEDATEGGRDALLPSFLSAGRVG